MRVCVRARCVPASQEIESYRPALSQLEAIGNEANQNDQCSDPQRCEDDDQPVR